MYVSDPFVFGLVNDSLSEMVVVVSTKIAISQDLGT